MKSKFVKIAIWLPVLFFILIILFGGSYTYWNAASPEKTCASCHEISPSHETWASSAHSQISCFMCHGTALGNGWHSLSEKANMVFTHVKSAPNRDDVRMTEDQLLETMQRCKNCHQTEYSNWLASGHSASYSNIFLDSLHNMTEQLNFDCLRCHGMFNARTTYDLVEPISTQGPWKLKDENLAEKATIPCLACHKIHSRGMPSVRPDYANPNFIFYGRIVQNNSIAFYNRNEQTHFNLANLPTPVILNDTDTVQTPNDPVYRLCVQCHAPSVRHQAGSSDDHTPTGVHEGLSCRACHESHSNYQRNSCDKCHPGKSKNCKLDVKEMNTTFLSPSSENDIHFVECKDCHKDFQSKTSNK
jgi:nitrate/TMAO reductase-like tetraheme cytochrome c subunit